MNIPLNYEYIKNDITKWWLSILNSEFPLRGSENQGIVKKSDVCI